MKVSKDKESMVITFEDEDIAKIVTWINHHKNSIENGKLSNTPSATEREVIYNDEKNNFDIVLNKTFYKNGDDKDKFVLTISTVDNNRTSNIFTSNFDINNVIIDLEHTIKYHIKRSAFLSSVNPKHHNKTIKVQVDNFRN